MEINDPYLQLLQFYKPTCNILLRFYASLSSFLSLFLLSVSLTYCLAPFCSSFHLKHSKHLGQRTSLKNIHSHLALRNEQKCKPVLQ